MCPPSLADPCSAGSYSLGASILCLKNLMRHSKAGKADGRRVEGKKGDADIA